MPLKIKGFQWGGKTDYGKSFELSSDTKNNMANFNSSYEPQPIYTFLPPIQTDYNFRSFQQQPLPGQLGFIPKNIATSQSRKSIPNITDYQSNNWKGLNQETENKDEENATDKGDDDKKDKGGNGGFTGIGGWPEMVAKGVSTATTTFGKNWEDEGFRDEEAISHAAYSFGPFGALSGAMASLSSQVTRATDIDTSKLSERARRTAGISKSAKIGNNVMSWFNNTTFGSGFTSFIMPFAGASPMWGHSKFMPKTSEYNMSTEAEQLSGAYSGTTSDMKVAEEVAGKRYFFGMDKLNDLVNRSIENDKILTQVGIDNEQRVSSIPYNASDIASRNFKKIYGMSGQETRIGKSGMKLLSREELDRIYSARKTEESDVQKFQNGGSILIPDGKLHAHKHHMDEVNPELAEDLTKKGIPVITTDENGEVTQVAEIEKQEIILEKSLTEQIEELWKDGSEEAMIKAGKLIVDTLFTNCDDNANLIEEVQYEKNQDSDKQ